MFPAALGHAGGGCWTMGAEWINGVEEGSTCSCVEREEAAAGAKNTILGWDACTQQGG